MKSNYGFKSYAPYTREEFRPYQSTDTRKTLPIRQTPVTPAYSDLLPKNVLSTLNNKEQIKEQYKRKCELSKEKINDDVDAILKDLIIIFEDFKVQLYNKVDEHNISFANLVTQLDGLAIDCSNWAEDRIKGANNEIDMKMTIDDTLGRQLNQARQEKMRADEHERALVAIKQKIEQMRLQDLNNDIAFLSDERNPDVYASHEIHRLNDSIRNDLKSKLTVVDQSKIVKPFLMDNKVVKSSDNRILINKGKGREEEKKMISLDNRNGSSIRPVGDLGNSNNMVVKPDFDSNVNTIQPINPQNKSTVSSFIAQQNHFFSGAIDLTNPRIKLENELYLTNSSKITCISALTPEIVLTGNDEGSFIIMDIEKKKKNDPNNQMLVHAHKAPVNLLKKTKNNLVLSTAVSPDNAIKIWDLANIANTSHKDNTTEVVMLVSELKGHSQTIVGADFLGERNIISASKDGVINVWDWKMSSPLSSFRIQSESISHFILMAKKDNFVIATNSGKIMNYSMFKSKNGYEFIKQGEFTESSPVTGLASFRGSTDVLIVTLLSGDVKLINKKSKETLNVIKGCKNPFSFFIFTCLKNNIDIYLLALEAYGFKIVDVDNTNFENVNTSALSSHRFEKMGEPSWQLLDSLPGEKVFFVTINHAVKPNALLIWSIQGNK